jgi:hypothetical protein
LTVGRAHELSSALPHSEEAKRVGGLIGKHR